MKVQLEKTLKRYELFGRAARRKPRVPKEMALPLRFASCQLHLNKPHFSTSGTMSFRQIRLKMFGHNAHIWQKPNTNSSYQLSSTVVIILVNVAEK